jgi:ketosteroid isomerase-like protein
VGRANETIQWLEAFAEAVRACDYARGQAMFAPEAVGFGTVAARAVGLERLVNEQWRRVWGVTHGFTFYLDALEAGGEEPVFWAAAPWSSFGRTANGVEVELRGRSTIVLVRREGKLLAVHSHFSFVPSGAVTPSPADELFLAGAVPGPRR